MAQLTSIIAAEDIRPITVADYHRMADAGAFHDGERVELVEGVIVSMRPQKTPHAKIISRLSRIFARALPEHLDVRPQLPLRVSTTSEPEPDMAVVEASAAPT